MASNRDRKKAQKPVALGQIPRVLEPEPDPEHSLHAVEVVVAETELTIFINMLERAGVEHKVNVTDSGVIVRIGDYYSYALWMFTPEGFLKSQHQYESNE